jgi:hypothetical protein
MKLSSNRSFLIIPLLIIGFLLYHNMQLSQKVASLTSAANSTAKSQESLAEKSGCQQDATAYYKEKESKGDVTSLYYLDSYGYNEKLNTCLLVWTVMQTMYDDSLLHVRHITDIYSNNDVYSWWEKKSPSGKLLLTQGNGSEYDQKLHAYGFR